MVLPQLFLILTRPQKTLYNKIKRLSRDKIKIFRATA